MQVINYSLLNDQDIALFREGKHIRLYEKMGSHVIELNGQKGTYFAVWAPTAEAVSVIGTFNDWEGGVHALSARWDSSGIWEGFIPDVGHGDLYKYRIESWKGEQLDKGDPFAHYWETRPNTASIVWEIDDYKWKDKKWLKNRSDKKDEAQPFSVYEVHLGSWKSKLQADGVSRALTYTELADDLVKYVSEMGFTHIEFMPIMEHPYDPSWGYQVTGYFAPTSRFGEPQEFMYLVDAFHQAGIGVLLDWVPSHFPTDAHGLANFDGTHLYDHADPRLGFHPDWKTCIFNYGRNEVRSFLISNALFWLDKYHIDGLRVDAVASMIYLDYSREEGQWIPNKYGGRENLEAISFLKEFNETVYREYPDTVTIAEESTAFQGVSHPTYNGGLGFGQKWMMGWMHDSLKYFGREPIYRSYHHNELTFSLVYAFSENFMLPFSHDEVVHGKASMIYKMPGDEWRRFANLRSLYSLMFTHPGSQLLFMGNEFAQTGEWNFKTQLSWELLQYQKHQGIQLLIKDLNKLYKTNAAFYAQQFDPTGFEWIAHDDNKNSVVAYMRKGEKEEDELLVVCNLTPSVHKAYELGVPAYGHWEEIFNSDAKKYGGSGVQNEGKLKPSALKADELLHGSNNSLSLTLAPLSVTIFKPKGKKKLVKKVVSADIVVEADIVLN